MSLAIDVFLRHLDSFASITGVLLLGLGALLGSVLHRPGHRHQVWRSIFPDRSNADVETRREVL